jgi:hypothetical protein
MVSNIVVYCPLLISTNSTTNHRWLTWSDDDAAGWHAQHSTCNTSHLQNTHTDIRMHKQQTGNSVLVRRPHACTLLLHQRLSQQLLPAQRSILAPNKHTAPCCAAAAILPQPGADGASCPHLHRCCCHRVCAASTHHMHPRNSCSCCPTCWWWEGHPRHKCRACWQWHCCRMHCCCWHRCHVVVYGSARGRRHRHCLARDTCWHTCGQHVRHGA